MFKTLADLLAVLNEIQFNNWQFIAGEMGDGFFVQIQFRGRDNFTGELHQAWGGRKWYVSKHATRAEVVQTCLKAVLTALEHEAREQFTYVGVPIFHPHVDIDRLTAVAMSKVERAPMVDVRGHEMTGP